MAATQNPFLILLDLADQYLHFEQRYDAQYFARFADRNRCVLHALSNRPRVSLFHFFIPNAENTLINTRILFNNTIFYIYCTDDAAIRTMKQTYNYPMYVKVFHHESLATRLHQAAVDYLIEYAERNRHEPDEHDVAYQGAIHHLERLAEELTEHAIVKTGAPPRECR